MATLVNGICTTSQRIDIFSNGTTGILTLNSNGTLVAKGSSSAFLDVTSVGGSISIGTTASSTSTILIGQTGGVSTTIQGGIINIFTGTSNLNLGSNANNKQILIGSTGSAISDTIKIGNGGTTATTSVSICTTQTTGSTTIALGTTNTSGTGTTTINAGSGGLTLNAYNMGAVNLGVASTAQTLTIGNVTGGTAVNVNTGTGGTTYTTTNGIFTLATGTGTVTVSGDATNNAINIATGAAVKSLTLGSTNTTSSVTINTGSGGITIPSFTTTGALVSTSAGLITDATASTTGFILASNGSSTAPSFQSMSSLGGFTWNNTTGSTQTMAVNNGYVSNDGATLVTFTLPATAAVLQRVSIQGAGSGLWTIAQNAGQTIHSNYVSTTTGVTGTVSSTNQYDSIDLICITANTDFAVRSIGGNVNFV